MLDNKVSQLHVTKAELLDLAILCRFNKLGVIYPYETTANGDRRGRQLLHHAVSTFLNSLFRLFVFITSQKSSSSHTQLFLHL